MGSIARFAGSLAVTEAAAWREDTGDIATRAYEARRFLLADRLMHWAIPWLLASRLDVEAEFLLGLGDEMRAAPVLPGREGLLLAGEDSYGPITNTGGIWSGWVEIESGFEPGNTVRFWREMANQHPGTGQLWLDLADRAGRM